MKQLPKETLGSRTHGRGSNQVLIGEKGHGYQIHGTCNKKQTNWTTLSLCTYISPLTLSRATHYPQISTTISFNTNKEKKDKKANRTKWLGMSRPTPHQTSRMRPIPLPTHLPYYQSPSMIGENWQFRYR